MKLLPIFIPLLLLGAFVMYWARRTPSAGEARRVAARRSWQGRQIDSHPWLMSAGLGLFWGLATGAIVVLTSRPPGPALVLGAFVALGLVGFGPIVVYLARRRAA